MAFVRHDLARGALPYRFSGVAIDAQDVELIVVRRCLNVEAVRHQRRPRSRAIAVRVGRGLFALGKRRIYRTQECVTLFERRESDWCRRRWPRSPSGLPFDRSLPR